MWGPPPDTSHIGRVIFVATSTPRTVAAFRTLPEIVMSCADTRGCCSANATRRSLTSCNRSTSCRIALKGMSRTPWDIKLGKAQPRPDNNAINTEYLQKEFGPFHQAIDGLRVLQR